MRSSTVSRVLFVCVHNAGDVTPADAAEVVVPHEVTPAAN
jgi:hypothetical protein